MMPSTRKAAENVFWNRFHLGSVKLICTEKLPRALLHDAQCNSDAPSGTGMFFVCE